MLPNFAKSKSSTSSTVYKGERENKKNCLAHVYICFFFFFKLNKIHSFKQSLTISCHLSSFLPFYFLSIFILFHSFIIFIIFYLFIYLFILFFLTNTYCYLSICSISLLFKTYKWFIYYSYFCYLSLFSFSAALQLNPVPISSSWKQDSPKKQLAKRT